MSIEATDPWASYATYESKSAPELAPAPPVELPDLSRLSWMEAMTEAVARGLLKADSVGYGLLFTRGAFDYDTGRQFAARTFGFLAETTAHSDRTWKRQIKTLREKGWLVPTETRVFDGQATNLYQLADPTAAHPG